MKIKSLSLLLATFGSVALSHWPINAGTALRHYYDPVPGNSVADLTGFPSFPATPSFSEVLTEFLEGVDNQPDNYGSWIRGYLEAPQTGDYVFWIASDDDGEFWLSSDHIATNRRKIAENVGAVGNRDFTVKPQQQSEPVSLERGKKYYFEVLHKEGTGAAHVAVGWRWPDGTLQRPIPGDRLMPFPVDAAFQPRQTAPVVLTDYVGFPVPGLADISATEGEAVTLRVTVEATQPAAFQWLRNGTAIPDAILSSYAIPAVPRSDNGARISVRISNALGTVTSAAVTLTVAADTTAPTVVRALTRGNPNGLEVVFSEPLDEASATNRANYVISSGVTVSGAMLVAPATVRLTTSAIGVGSVYTLTVNNVRDRASAPNAIAANSQTMFLQVQGVITRREFQDIPGGLLSDLTNHARFPTRPDVVDYPDLLETPPQRSDNYGVLFQGFVTPPVSGDYVFYISSRNQGVLYLSRDENPANKTAIAREPEFNTPRNWEGTDRRPNLENISAPQPLVAGRRYYIEALMKAAASPDANKHDNLAVAWVKPGDAPLVNGDSPIPGEFLSSMAQLGPVTITTHPVSQSVAEVEPVKFSVAVDGTPPYNFQWLKNGQPIAGGNAATLSMASASLADNGAAITVNVSNSFSQITSSPATLTVQRDSTPPRIESVTARNVATAVTVTFSEPLEEAKAANKANYAINQSITISEAKLLDDRRTVILTTSALSSGVSYTLTVTGVSDLAGQPNTIAPNSTKSFTFFGSARASRGLQVLYTFREGSGTAINDVSGVGAPLNLKIEEPQKVSWVQGGGLSINQETRIVSEGPATKINQAAKASNELTVEVWVKPANIEQQGPARIVTISQGPNNPDRNFSLNQGRFGEAADQRSKWSARLSAGSNLSPGSGTLSTPTGTATTELQQVVFTVNAAAGTAIIYVNGQEVTAGTVSAGFSDWVVDRGLALVNEAGLVGSGRSWLGELHLIAIYSSTLTLEEIQQNFRLGPGPTRVTDGLQALYSFQERSGTKINDLSGIGLPLNLTIEEPQKVAWLPGGGLSIKQETRIVSEGPATKINQAAKASNELSVEVWVKPANIEQQGPARIVTISQGPNNPDRNFSLNQGRFGEAADQRSKWSARLSAGSNLSPGSGTLSTPTGTATTELQQVVFTVNAAAGTAIIYVNGQEVTAGTVTAGFSDWVVDRGLALVNEAGLVGSGRSWLGELHLIAIYSRALSAVQVKQNFEAGSGTTPSPDLPTELQFAAVTREPNGNLVIRWTGTGTLEQADAVTGPWSAAPSQANPQTVTPTGSTRFFRLRR
ncbi:MAG: Ig-like domain-containing protein [Verrucomicrobia bacterium]|nr:Ig-like domain-containing protein [Verrucomicrobiota bacterium]